MSATSSPASSSAPLTYLLLAFAPIMWGGNFVVGRGLGDEVDPAWLNLARWATAATVLVPFGLMPLWRGRRTALARLPALIGLAMLGVTSFNTLLYFGLRTTTVATAAIAFAATPFLIALLASLAEARAPSARVIVAASVSFGGVLLTLDDFGAAWDGGDTGSALVAASAIVWAIYCVALKRLAPTLPHPAASFFAQVLIGLALQLPLALALAPVPSVANISYAGLVGIAYLGVFAAALAFLAWQTALPKVGADRAGVFMNLVPVSALVLSWALLDEAPTRSETIGATLIVVAIVTMMTPRPGRLRGASRSVRRISSMKSTYASSFGRRTGTERR